MCCVTNKLGVTKYPRVFMVGSVSCEISVSNTCDTHCTTSLSGVEHSLYYVRIASRKEDTFFLVYCRRIPCGVYQITCNTLSLKFSPSQVQMKSAALSYTFGPQSRTQRPEVCVAV
jgi:hypothetical protein